MMGGAPYDYNKDDYGFKTPAPLSHAAITTAAEWAAFNTNPVKKFREDGSEWPVNYSWTGYPPGNPPLLTINEAADGYRLPSLNQWRWAAMGADMSPSRLVNGVNTADWAKPFSGYNGNNNVADYVWFNDARTVEGGGGDGIFEVAKKKPNELGIYDMNGNMEEWVWDSMDGTKTSLWPGAMTDTDYQDAAKGYGANDRLLMGGWSEDLMSRMNLSFFDWRNSDHDRQGPDIGVDGTLSGPKSQGFRVMRLVESGE
jgi:formylglycine-generating enzyme required for sulfatase activity